MASTTPAPISRAQYRAAVLTLQGLNPGLPSQGQVPETTAFFAMARSGIAPKMPAMAHAFSPAANETLPRWPLLAAAILAALLLGAMLIATEGHFVYALDDAYIHLAFAEQLAAGHFGLTPQEIASPSSSILWPLLLVPLSGTFAHQFVPLALGLAALLVSVLLWQFVLQNFVLKPLPSRDRATMGGVLALVAVAAGGQMGAPFTGMEHAVQALLALAVVAGLIEFVATGRLRWWLLAAIALGPLIRYENLSFSLVAIALLCWRGQWRPALAALLAIALGIAGYALAANAAGLPPLPGSALTKSAISGAAPLHSLYYLLRGSLEAIARGEANFLLLLALAAIGLRALLPGPMPSRLETLFGLGIFACVAAQLALAGSHHLARYDLYAVAGGLMGAAYLHRESLARALARLDGWRLAAIAVVLAVLCAPTTLAMLALTPFAAQDIYRQQYQMRRFALEQAQTRIAVNDAGLMAYRNPYGMFDVVGLGSEAMRLAWRDQSLGADTVKTMLAQRGIDTLMIYPQWFAPRLLDGAIPVARFHLGRRKIVVSEDTVVLLAMTPAAAARLRAQAAAFAPTMPAGTRVEVLEGR